MNKRLLRLSVALLIGGPIWLYAIDSDQDGMSDVWQEKYSVPSTDATSDYTGNGLTNTQKSQLGLDPRNSNSRFDSQIVYPGGQTDLHVFFQTVFGKLYQIENNTDLGIWSATGPNVTGTDGQADYTATIADPSITKTFFRVRYIGDVDADGDGLTAWEERELTTNDADSDTDDDGIPDGWEYSHGLNSKSNPGTNEPNEDPDGDGLSNFEEYELDTDPWTDSTVVGVTQGKLSAQPSGAATYEIPIAVSPGTAGMQPKLSFQYSSGGRNGVLGIGWSIGGLSAITRAPQTLAQDTKIRGVDMTINDRYAMDGQRLIAINGTEGGVAEYRTEINSFTKVTSEAGTNGPSRFTAKTKSGLTYTFGDATGAPSTGASFTAGLTDGTIFMWLVSKIEDQAGNYMTFHYSPEGNIVEIKYTMNQAGGLGTHYASVKFAYEGRNDFTAGYVAGSQILMTERLKRVTSYYGSQLVRRYNLKYEISQDTKKSRLVSIREAATGGAFPATQFNYQQVTNGLNLTATVGVGGTKDQTHWIQGDFDGDGLSDLLRARTNSLQVIKVSNGSLLEQGGSFTSVSPSVQNDDDIWVQGDFNGDGKLDAVRVKKNTQTGDVAFKLYKNNGTNDSNAFTQLDMTIIAGSMNFNNRRFLVLDLNGDGRLDIVGIQVFNANNSIDDVSIKVALNNPSGNPAFTGTFVIEDWTPAGTDKLKQYDRWLVGDFNGDGLPDLVKVYNDGGLDGVHSVRVYVNQTIPGQSSFYGSFSASVWLTDDRHTLKTQAYDYKFAYTWATGDFNGDGLIDLVRIPRPNNRESANDVAVFLSKGSALAASKFVAETWLTGITVTDDGDGDKQTTVQTGDYNADGRADIIVLRDETTGINSYTLRRTELLSDGKAFYLQGTADVSERAFQTNGPLELKKWFTADFNGDGKEDLIRSFDDNGETTFDIYRTNPGFQDLLVNVTDGMGSSTSVEYLPLTGTKNGAPIFTKSTDAVAPAVDLIVPMPVVAGLTYDNGLGSSPTGNTYNVNYLYTGLKADPKRGMLGFRSVEAIDDRTLDGQSANVRLRSKSWLKQGFPYTGMAERSIAYLGDMNPLTTKNFADSTGLLSLSTTTHAAGPTENSKVYFPYAQNSRVQAWDINTSHTQTNDTETTAQEIDAFGNTTVSVVKTKDLGGTELFFTKTTTSVYPTQPDITNWRIGQVTSSTVTHEAPNQPNKTRNSGFGYDPTNGQIKSETEEPTDATWVKTDYEYDSFGNTKKAITSSNESDAITDEAVPSRTTETTYDPESDNYGRFLTQIKNAVDHTETKLYDARFGAVISVIGPNGLTDSAEYDGFSRQKRATRLVGTSAAANTYTKYEWVASNSNAPNAPTNSMYLVRVTTDGAPESLTYFDRLGREMRRRTLDVKNRAILIDTGYDSRGRKNTITKPYFATDSPVSAITFYDAMDRPVRTEAPSRNDQDAVVIAVTVTSYDGFYTSITNPNNQTTRTKKDAAGHVVEVRDALQGTITYTYDAVGNLTETKDAAQNATTIEYDPIRGRKTSVNDPDLGLWRYDYYATGELKWQKDAKNQEVKFSYDKLGRVVQRNEPNDDYTKWTYDTAPGAGKGQLYKVEIFTPQDIKRYSNEISYDSLGRSASQSRLIGGTTYSTGTAYDTLSRPTTLTYPTGFQVTNIYSANGYLTDIKSPDGTKTYWTQNGTQGDNDAEGHITKETYGNGIVTDHIYRPESSLLKSITSGTNGVVQNLDYRFDLLGNLKRRTDNNQSLIEDFTYDDLNRLKTAQVAGQPVKNFTYDQINGTSRSLGNIAHKDDVGDYTYDTVHKHAVKNISTGGYADAVYDANANMTSGFGREITWTWFNMPSVITKGAALATFDYDADHNRVKQHLENAGGQAGRTVDTIYLGGFYEKVQDGNYDYLKHYISAPTGRVAVFTQKVQFVQEPGGPIPGTIVSSDTKYLHKDHLGSIDVITDETGTVLERDSFDAWGYRRTTNNWQTPTPIPGPIPSNLRSIVSRGFTDHEQLDDFGLVHMNGRIYDPGIGRFLSADPFVQAPMVTQNFNRYSYVVNNPLSLSDPSGFNIFDNFFKWLNSALGPTGTQIVIGTAAVAVGVVTAGAFAAAYSILYPTIQLGTFLAPTFAGSVVMGAGFGFGAGFTSTLLSGASIGQAFQAGVIGGIIGGISGGIANKLGSIPGAGEFLTPGHLGQTAGHAVLGGVVGEIQGDSFGSGALSGGLPALFGPAIGTIGGGTTGQHYEFEAARVAAAGIIGGTAAELGGGKFANGAVTAGFLRLFNEEAHRALERGEWRTATPGERKKLLGPTYHDSINYDRVRIYHKTFWWFQGSRMAITPNGHIYLGNEIYRDDYSLAANLNLQPLFVHEWTHVWQWQHHVAVWLRGPFDRKYHYTFVAGKPFTSYGLEQQASMVEDYFSAGLGLGMRWATNAPTRSDLLSAFPFGR